MYWVPVSDIAILKILFIRITQFFIHCCVITVFGMQQSPRKTIIIKIRRKVIIVLNTESVQCEFVSSANRTIIKNAVVLIFWEARRLASAHRAHFYVVSIINPQKHANQQYAKRNSARAS